MRELIPTFPRQVAFPERITCKTEEEFYKLINIYNGVKQKIYFSLYQCSRDGKFNNENFKTMIDKVSFDFDSEKSLENVKKMSNYCIKNNYRHCIIFSTGGFWIHIKTKNYSNLRNLKSALRNCQEWLANEVGLSIGFPKESDIDFHIIGDIARVARMPGTLDTGRLLFAQSIRKEDLTTLEHIKEIAKRQCNKIYWYGSDAIDISKFDYESITKVGSIDIPEVEFNYEVDDKLLSGLPPCIIDILTKKDKGTWRGRWLVTLYLRERGYPKQLVDKIAKKFFSMMPRTDGLRNNYEHYIKVKVLDLVYARQDLIFPNCETLFKEGWCPGKCKYYNKLYR